MKEKHVLLEHGGGGLLSHELIAEIFLPRLRNDYLERLEDSAAFTVEGIRLCMTTDSYVVTPLFFPGGDIGSLAVHGTVNDIAMSGGRPLFLSAGFILEEGFPFADLERIVSSMAQAAAGAGVRIITGDTKVVSRGAADGVYINTSGIGIIRYGGNISLQSISAGDAVLINGFIGDHGAAIMSQREELGLETPILSDSAPLHGLVEAILDATPHIHFMRDATRGGLGAILAEVAQAAGLEIQLIEGEIPVRDTVRGVCEILGLDPLFLANEGKMAVFCPLAEAETVLQVMRRHPQGREAALIGRVQAARRGRLILTTIIGGTREIDLPVGELVPRIC